MIFPRVNLLGVGRDLGASLLLSAEVTLVPEIIEIFDGGEEGCEEDVKKLSFETEFKRTYEYKPEVGS